MITKYQISKTILRVHSLPKDAHDLKGENLSEFEFRRTVSDKLVINNALSEGLLSKIPYRPTELKDSIKSWTAPKDLSQDEVIMLDHSSPDSQIICTNEILEYLEILDREYFRYRVKITRGQKDQFAKLDQRYKDILADIESAIKELQAFKEWLSSLTLFKFDDELNGVDLIRFLSKHLKIDFSSRGKNYGFKDPAAFYKFISKNIYKISEGAIDRAITRIVKSSSSKSALKKTDENKKEMEAIADTYTKQLPIKDKWDKRVYVSMGTPPLHEFPVSFYY